MVESAKGDEFYQRLLALKTENMEFLDNVLLKLKDRGKFARRGPPLVKWQKSPSDSPSTPTSSADSFSAEEESSGTLSCDIGKKVIWCYKIYKIYYVPSP